MTFEKNIEYYNSLSENEQFILKLIVIKTSHSFPERRGTTFSDKPESRRTWFEPYHCRLRNSSRPLVESRHRRPSVRPHASQ